jgi:hypothetical protein
MAGTLKAMREGGAGGEGSVEVGTAVATGAMLLTVGGDEVVLDERAMVEVQVSRVKYDAGKDGSGPTSW